MLWWLAETTAVAAALAGAVALLCRRLRPRPAVRHALWLAVLAKLLMPPLLAWPWPAPAGAALRGEPTTGEAPRPPPEEMAVGGPADEPLTPWPPPDAFVAVAPAADPAAELRPGPEPEPAAEVVARATTEPPPLVAAHPPTERWATGLLVAWVSGAALMALLQMVRIVRFRRLAAGGQPAPVSLTAAVRELAALLGVRPPPVLVVPDLASPVVWGLGRPRLLWPAALLGRLAPDSERAAVVHELAHLRRHDHWVGWLHLIASCLWWWSPLYWYVRRQLGGAAELACDAWVIEALPRARRAYAEALLEVCELVSRRAAPAPALGMGGARQEIERRLTMILRESVPSRAPVRALFGVVLLALIALPGLTDGQPSADRAPPADNLAQTKQPPVDVKAQHQPAPDKGDTAKGPAVDEREQRLRKLEANLEALLKEVKEMRGAAGKTEKPAQPGLNQTRPGGQPYGYAPGATSLDRAPEQPGQPISLQRVTYTLPKDKADALAALLKDLKSPEVETQVKADGIVVTTTPEGQRVVGDFVRLLQGQLHRSAHWGAYDTAPGANNYPKKQ
jgi:beta-lactamase regulating signal transducer with metallopeptidase domain